MSELSDAAVIAESWSSPEVFGVVFDRHFVAVHRYLGRRLSTADADELAGEVFRIGFEKRRGFDPSYESALPWLYGITSNLVLKHHRRESRSMRALGREHRTLQPLHVDGNSEVLVDGRIDAIRSHTRVVHELKRLATDERELLLLAAFADLSYRELAEATGLPEGTVRSKLSRTKAKLRERLGPIGEELVEPPRTPARGGQQ